MAHQLDGTQLATLIQNLDHPMVKSLLSLTAASGVALIWQHNGLPMPGFGESIADYAATRTEPSSALHFTPSPNIPPIDIFGQPDVELFSVANFTVQTNLPELPILLDNINNINALNSSPLKIGATVGGLVGLAAIAYAYLKKRNSKDSSQLTDAETIAWLHSELKKVTDDMSGVESQLITTKMYALNVDHALAESINREEALGKEAVSINASKHALEQQIDKLTSDIAELQSQIVQQHQIGLSNQEVEQLIDKLTLEITDLQSQSIHYDEIEIAKQELEQQIKKLTADIAGLQSQILQHDQINVSNRELEQQVDKLTSDILGLQAQIIQYDQVVTSNQELEQHVAALTSEISNLQSQIKQHDQAKISNQELEQQVAKLTSHIAELQSQIARQDQIQPELIQRHQAELENKSQTFRKLKDNYDRIFQSLRSHKQQKEELQGKLDALTEAKAQLQCELADVSALRDDITLRQQELNQQVATAQKERDDLATKNRSLQQEVIGLTQQNKNITAQYDQLTGHLEAAERRNTDFEQTNNAMVQRLQGLEEGITKLTEEQQAMSASKDVLEMDAAEQKSKDGEELTKLRSEKDHLQLQIDKATEAHDLEKKDFEAKLNDYQRRKAEDELAAKECADRNRKQLEAYHEKQLDDVRNKSEADKTSLQLSHQVAMDEKSNEIKHLRGKPDADLQAAMENERVLVARLDALQKEKEDAAKTAEEHVLKEREALLLDKDTAVSAAKMAAQEELTKITSEQDAEKASELAAAEKRAKQQAESLEQEHAKAITRLEGVIHDLRTEQTNSKSELEQQKTEYNGRYSALEVEMKEQLSSLLAKYNQAKEDLTRHESVIKEKDDKIKQLDEQKVEADEALKAKEQELARNETTIGSTNKDLVNQLETKNNEVEELRQQLEQVTKNEAAKEQNLEKHQLELKELREDNEKQLGDATKREQKLKEEHQVELDAKTRALTKLTADIQPLREYVGTLQAYCMQKNESHNKELAALNEELMMAHMEEDGHDDAVSKLITDQAELEEKLQKAEAKVKELEKGAKQTTPKSMSPMVSAATQVTENELREKIQGGQIQVSEEKATEIADVTSKDVVDNQNVDVVVGDEAAQDSKEKVNENANDTPKDAVDDQTTDVALSNEPVQAHEEQPADAKGSKTPAKTQSDVAHGEDDSATKTTDPAKAVGGTGRLPPVNRFSNRKNLRKDLAEHFTTINFREQRYPDNKVIELQLPYLDPCYKDIPIIQPVQNPQISIQDGKATHIQCNDCLQWYTRDDIYDHFPVCKAFFKYAKYCKHFEKNFMNNAAFKEMHARECKIEDCQPEFPWLTKKKIQLPVVKTDTNDNGPEQSPNLEKLAQDAAKNAAKQDAGPQTSTPVRPTPAVSFNPGAAAFSPGAAAFTPQRAATPVASVVALSGPPPTPQQPLSTEADPAPTHTTTALLSSRYAVSQPAIDQSAANQPAPSPQQAKAPVKASQHAPSPKQGKPRGNPPAHARGSAANTRGGRITPSSRSNLPAQQARSRPARGNQQQQQSQQQQPQGRQPQDWGDAGHNVIKY